MTARYRNRSSIDDVALDPVFASQYPVDPEAVQTRLMDHNKRVKLPQSNLSLPAQFAKANEQAGNVTAGNGVS